MKKALLIVSIILLNGCSLYHRLYDDPEVPDLTIPEEFKVEVKFENSHLKNRWWENFHDEKLDRLVELALKYNYNYRVTLKNIEIAETYVSQNQSYLFPQVNSSFSTSRDKFTAYEFIGFPVSSGSGNSPYAAAAQSSSSTLFPSAIYNIQALSATATYEVDVWNSIRNSVKEAKANVVVSAADSNVTKLTLIGNVVNAYYQIMALNSIIDNFHKQYKAAQEITEISKVQFKSGLIDESNVYAAENQAEAILVNLKNAEKQKQIVEFTLAYLLGAYPENFHVEPRDHLNDLHYNQLIPAGLPSHMIAMRPDIQAAYFELLSYGYTEKQTIANFLPSFTLTGLYGYAYPDFRNLFDNQNAFWSYGLGVSQYVFDYAVRESEYERAGHQFEAAILSYKDTVVNAFSEVNSSLASYEEDYEALSAYRQQYANSKELAGIANAQYHAGLANYATYLSTELSLLQTQYNVTNQQLVVIQDIIQVYKSLGLGLAIDE